MICSTGAERVGRLALPRKAVEHMMNIMARVASSQVLHRLFFALVPPRGAADRLAAVRDGLVLRSKVGNGRFHITLGISEDFAMFDPALAAAMRAIGDCAGGEPLRIVLDRLAGSASSVALRPAHAAPALRALQRGLGQGLRRAGIARRGWRFYPHLTLGYRDAAPFGEAVKPIAWEAHDFVLIHSVVRRTIHRELARWPLSTRQHSLPFG